MERTTLDRIAAWNGSVVRKPLVLMGARQVGKTWLMEEFARTHYAGRTVCVNLMKMKALRRRLDGCDLAPKDVLEEISMALDAEIVPGKTLLVIDEIQESASTLTALKFFNEELPELAVMAAGSLLGLAVGRAEEEEGSNRLRRSDNPNEKRGSFPVGKVNFLDVRPMSFVEFVRAIGRRRLSDKIATGDFAELEPYSDELTELLRKYLVIGGMPEALATYVDRKDLSSVREVQETILDAYDADFVKHAPIALLPKIRLLWRNIPAQLAKENKKFIYTALKAGARAREYEVALQWLEDAGMLHQIFRVGTARLPLKSYQDFSAFKLYALDVGLLGALSDLDPRTLMEGNALFTNFKGALTEQYVLQEMLVNGMNPCYWTNDAGNAELEFVIQGAGGVVPIEAKAGINTQAKSLKVLRQLFSPPFSVRTSLAAASDGSAVKDVPLYGFGPALRRWAQSSPMCGRDVMTRDVNVEKEMVR